MFKNHHEVQEFCRNNEIEFIDFKLLDLAGRWHHLTITPRRFTEETITQGIGFDGSSYGFLSVEKSDMVFKPDLESYFIDPFNESKTLVFMTRLFKVDEEHYRFESDPRFICEKAMSYMKEMGHADQVLLGPEFEYYTFDRCQFELTPQASGYLVDTQQAEWHSGKVENNSGYIVAHKGGYHVDRPKDINFDMRNEIVGLLEQVGVPVKYHHPEVGGPGQQEIELDFEGPVIMGDRSMLVKYIIKNTSHLYGRTATFMPKPIYGEAGSGMHVHMQLLNEGVNLFYEKGGYSNMSKIGLYAMGGILKHAPSLMAFTNPSTNSFKRLVPGYEAPVSLCFGTANRSSVVRIPGYAIEPNRKRFEFRPSDATANPYLAYAALMMAMFDGIENQIDPIEQGYGPIDVNIFKLTEEERRKIGALPKDLYEVIDAIENDQAYLLKSGVFTKAIIADQIDYLKKEALAEGRQPSPREYKVYYDL